MRRSLSWWLVGGVGLALGAGGLPAETRIEWQETATERIKIKYEDEVEVGRWTFPKKGAATPAVPNPFGASGAPGGVPNPFGAKAGPPPGMAGKLGGPNRWPPGFAPPLPGSAGGMGGPGGTGSVPSPFGRPGFAPGAPGGAGGFQLTPPGGRPGAGGRPPPSRGFNLDEDDEDDGEGMDDEAAEAEAMEAARQFLLQQGIDPDSVMGGGAQGGFGGGRAPGGRTPGGFGGPAMPPGGFGGPAYPGGMQGGYEGMGSSAPPGFGGGGGHGWGDGQPGGAPQGAPSWMQPGAGGPPPRGGFPGGGYPGMGGGQPGAGGGAENQLVGRWRRQYEGNYGVYVEVIAIHPGGRYEKFEGSDIFVPGTQPGQGGYQHGGGGGSSQATERGSFRILGNQIQIQGESGESGTASFQMGQGFVVIDGKRYDRIQ